MRPKGPLTRDQVEEQVGTTGGFTIPTWRQRGGLLWILLLVVLLALVLSGGLPGGDESVNLREVLKPFPATPAADGRSLGNPDAPGYVARVAGDVQQTWKSLFRRAGIPFRPAKLVVFERVAKTNCGQTLAASTDAFYCHFDSRLALDAGLTGTYPIAHAYAHHVQELLGITGQVARAGDASPSQARDFWRRHELQADCLAGVWMYSAQAKADGADAIRRAPVPADPDHYVDRESWAAPVRIERDRWFTRGYAEGKASVCDTFTKDA